jgi:outer membrane protein OmpA-like peptidoglycan-associated protein
MEKLFGKPVVKATHHSGEEWITYSDLMSGLMMVFLFIAISYMSQVVKDKDRIKEVAETWQETQEKIYQALLTEFKDDLVKWDAEIERSSLIVRFRNPETLFEKGEAVLSQKYKDVLTDFFPRYIKSLSQYLDSISEIRIEGHTSSTWGNKMGDEAYFLNMELSQQRTRVVLEYCLLLPSVTKHKIWLRRVLMANGLSSSRLVMVQEVEDEQKSRRVEFRVNTNAEEKIVEILEQAQ